MRRTPRRRTLARKPIHPSGLKHATRIIARAFRQRRRGRSSGRDRRSGLGEEGWGGDDAGGEDGEDAGADVGGCAGVGVAAVVVGC